MRTGSLPARSRFALAPHQRPAVAAALCLVLAVALLAWRGIHTGAGSRDAVRAAGDPGPRRHGPMADATRSHAARGPQRPGGLTGAGIDAQRARARDILALCIRGHGRTYTIPPLDPLTPLELRALMAAFLQEAAATGTDADFSSAARAILLAMQDKDPELALTSLEESPAWLDPGQTVAWWPQVCVDVLKKQAQEDPDAAVAWLAAHRALFDRQAPYLNAPGENLAGLPPLDAAASLQLIGSIARTDFKRAMQAIPQLPVEQSGALLGLTGAAEGPQDWQQLLQARRTLPADARVLIRSDGASVWSRSYALDDQLYGALASRLDDMPWASREQWLARMNLNTTETVAILSRQHIDTESHDALLFQAWVQSHLSPAEQDALREKQAAGRQPDLR